MNLRVYAGEGKVKCVNFSLKKEVFFSISISVWVIELRQRKKIVKKWLAIKMNHFEVGHQIEPFWINETDK